MQQLHPKSTKIMWYVSVSAAVLKYVVDGNYQWRTFTDSKGDSCTAPPLRRYDPPWTLPFLKTNELWFPLPLSREEVIAKLPTT